MTNKKRLLHQLIPIQYNILLKPDLTTFTFQCEEMITFFLKEDAKSISFHAHNLEMKRVTLLEKGEEIVPKVSYDKKKKTVTFLFPKKILAGEKKLEIICTGIISDQLQGWYKSAYTTNGRQTYLATTHFEQIGAREVFVSIDDPSAKAVFHISFLIPSHLTAISNTIDTSVVQHESGHKTITFSPTPKMATYTLVFIVGEFEYVEKKTKNGVLVRVFVTPGKKPQANFALETAVKMLPFYENYFDIPYPLPVLDLIAIPDFDAGAMENWGAITAREVSLLVDEEHATAANKQWVATVIAHEIAHMWFGNLVTMQWWGSLWLNEGFASYMEYVGVHAFFPQWNMWEQFLVLDHNRALSLDGLKSTHPIQINIADVEKVAEIFDEVSYSKSSSIIQMIVEYIGEEKFRDGLRYYLKKHAYGNTITQDLWDALEKISGKNISRITKAFTEKPGYPLISVSMEKSKKSLRLTQRRFFSSSISRENTQDKTIWSIPLQLISDKDSQQILFDTKVKEIPFSADWIKINSRETSFARTIYEESMYQHLKNAVEEKTLSNIDRMGLVRDVFDSCESGYLSTETALQFSQSYHNEFSYIVWACLSGKLSKVENIISEEPVLLGKFQQFGRNLFIAAGEKIGWEKKKNDSHEDILLRSILLGALGQYKDAKTIQKARELFTLIKKDKTNVDTDIRGVVYVLTAENGGREEFESLKNMYITEELSSEKNRIGNALCLFEDPKFIQEALDFSLSQHVRSQDIGRFLVLSFGNKKGKEITWNFIKKHWDLLIEKMEGLSIDWIISGASGVTSEKLAEDIHNFFASHPYPTLEKAMKQVEEQIQANIAWLERDREAIGKFLQKEV